MLHADQYSDKDCYEKEEDHRGNSHHYPNNDSSVHPTRTWRWCGVTEIVAQEEEEEGEGEEEEEEEKEEMCGDTTSGNGQPTGE